VGTSRILKRARMGIRFWSSRGLRFLLMHIPNSCKKIVE